MDNANNLPRATPDAERREFWNARYAAGAAWSGHVNPALETVAAALAPGTALDLGCGEGGDVLWLAENGWDATGIDGAAPALERARDEAEQRGLVDRAEFLERDLARWRPDRRWDLVACHYLHEAAELREAVLDAAAAAVAPGGTLLVVGHHPDEPEHLQGPPRAGRFTAEELALAPRLADGWSLTTAARPRTSIREGRTVERLDAVLIAVAPSD